MLVVRLVSLGSVVALVAFGVTTTTACGNTSEPEAPADPETSTLPSTSDGDGGNAAAPSNNPSSTSSSSSSSGGSSGTTTNGGGGGAADAGPPPPPAACVTKDSKANDKGVGAFCDDATMCSFGSFCNNGGLFGGDDEGEPTYCTKICISDNDCGAGAHCGDPGEGCVLDACKAK